MEGRPQHLRALAEAMRAIRDDADLTLKQLSALSHYAESTLSRATNALDLPPWKVTKAFLTHCGVVDLDMWQTAWEDTRKRHEAYLAEGSGTRPRTSLEQSPPPIASEKSVDLEQLLEERAPTLTFLLQRAQTPEQLIDAIRLLGARAGATSLRQMEKRSRIAKSTIRDWLAGARRPTPERLDGLVQALGATPAEQRQFAQCMERVWSQRPPVLEVNPKMVLSPIGTKRGGHCLMVMVTVYDRHVESGLVMLANKPTGVLGITTGPGHSVIGGIALLPRVPRRTEFSIGIWLSSPAEAAGALVELNVQMETGEAQWAEQIQIKIPTAVRARPPANRPPRDPYPGPDRNRPTSPTMARASALNRARQGRMPLSDPQVRSPRPVVRLVKEEYPSVSERVTSEPPASTDYRPKHRKNGKPRGLFGRWGVRKRPAD